MGYQDRWPRALQAARGVLGQARRGDRTGLVFFGDTAEVAAPLTDDRAVLEAALDGAELGWGGTRFAPALKLGLRLLDESGLPKRELVLVSDFQSRALDGLEEDPAAGGHRAALRQSVAGGDAQPGHHRSHSSARLRGRP